MWFFPRALFRCAIDEEVNKRRYYSAFVSHPIPLWHFLLLLLFPSHLLFPNVFSPVRGKGKGRRGKGGGTPFPFPIRSDGRTDPTFLNSANGRKGKGRRRKVFKSEQHILTSSSPCSVRRRKEREREGGVFPLLKFHFFFFSSFSSALALALLFRARGHREKNVPLCIKNGLLNSHVLKNNLSVAAHLRSDMGLAKYLKKCLCFSPSLLSPFPFPFLPSLSLRVQYIWRKGGGEEVCRAPAPLLLLYFTHTHTPLSLSFLIHALLLPSFPAAFSERNEGKKGGIRRRRRSVLAWPFEYAGNGGGTPFFPSPPGKLTCGKNGDASSVDTCKIY